MRLAKYLDDFHIAAMHNDTVGPASRTFIEAISCRRMVTAIYNGGELSLAPHSLLLRHGALHISAVNASRSGRGDDPVRIGLFRLAGLSEVRLTESTFEPVPADSAFPIRPDDQLVFPV